MYGITTRNIYGDNGIIPAGTRVLVTETRGGRYSIRGCGSRLKTTFDVVAGAVTPE